MLVDKFDLQEKLKQKLAEINSDFSEAEMLIDFLSVMIENNKDEQYVEEQLKDLVNADEAKTIASWVFEYLQNHKQPVPTRVFEMAMDGITKNSTRMNVDRPQRTTGRANDLRSLLKKGGNDRRNAPRNNRSEPYKVAKFEKEISTNIRCDFYPTCTRPDCQYIHPSEPCPKGIACTDLKCLFTHENDATRLKPRQKPTLACKFGAKCTNSACTYSHPKSNICKYGVGCKNADCHFSHPSPAAATTTIMPCKFYPNCLNAQCPFSHPPPIAALSNNPIPTSIENQQGTSSVIDDNIKQELGSSFRHPHE